MDMGSFEVEMWEEKRQKMIETWWKTLLHKKKEKGTQEHTLIKKGNLNGTYNANSYLLLLQS